MVLKHLKRQLIKNYRSDTDKLLDQLNQSENTPSIQFEIEKHAKLHHQRDQAKSQAATKDRFWENF